jgi:hypothetical protein
MAVFKNEQDNNKDWKVESVTSKGSAGFWALKQTRVRRT